MHVWVSCNGVCNRLTEYDILLQKAKEAAEQFRSTAKGFIPKMYHSLRNENANISIEDARDRIEKDCVGIWSRRTILDALPDEAKNKERQKSGRLRHKGIISAAFSAAQTSKRKVMINSMQGAVEHKDDIEPPNNFENNSPNNLAAKDDRRYSESAFQEEEIKVKNQEISNKQECIGCQEL
jgi:hypothetical protein